MRNIFPFIKVFSAHISVLVEIKNVIKYIHTKILFDTETGI